MRDESVSDASLRQFLLGKLSDDELERIESLFLTDSVMRERVLGVEQDLIEDYLEDSLSSDDREQFVLRYAQTAEQQRRLRITRSIKDWAIAEHLGRNAAVHSGPSTVSLWARVLEKLRLRPSFVVPIAAVIILAVVFAFIWLNRRNEQQRKFGIEQEVARLNSPEGLRENPPQMPVLSLSPLTLRSGQSPPELRLSSGVAVAELQLLGIERYPRYQAVVRRHGGDVLFTSPDLQAQEGNTIRLRVPTHLLNPGLYLIQLAGLTSDGSKEPISEYRLSVTE